jgi:hypothetical protein
VIPFVCAIPKSSRHDTHHRVAPFAAAIFSHPRRSSNRAAPSQIETRNQVEEPISELYATPHIRLAFYDGTACRPVTFTHGK